MMVSLALVSLLTYFEER